MEATIISQCNDMMRSLRLRIKNCHRCPISKLMPEGCFPVPGMGPSKAELVIVGEALGEDEALSGEPFVGRCGQLLDKMLKEAGIDREQAFVTNTVRCRPVEGKANRPPSKTEIQNCKTWLWKELQIVQPKVILTLGKVPTGTLLSGQLKKSFKLGNVVGTMFNVMYIDSIIVPCYHPSYLMVHGKAKMDDAMEILEKVKCLINT